MTCGLIVALWLLAVPGTLFVWSALGPYAAVLQLTLTGGIWLVSTLD